MLDTTQIAQRMNEKRCNTDLNLVYEMWLSGSCDQTTMRASDQNAIRKATAAIDRIALEVSRRLAPSEDTTFRVLPEVNSTTRVRKTPERLWLEFHPNMSDDDEATKAVVFIEFSRTQVNFGIRFASTSDTTEAYELSRLNQLQSLDKGDLAGWCIEQRRPPAESAACSSDLNTWLTGRVAAKRKNDPFLTISKTHSDSRPMMMDIFAGLDEAAQVCDKINDQSMSWKPNARSITALQSFGIIQR